MQPGADGTASARKGKLGWVIAPLLIFGALVAVFAFALQTGDPSKLPSALHRQAGPGDAVRSGRRAHGGRPPGAGLLQRRAARAGSRASSTSGRRGACRAPRSSRCWSNLQKRTGVALYGVNYKDDAASARRFLGRYGNPFAAVGTDDNGRAAIEWGVYGMPETFVLNGRGEIVFKHVGAGLAREHAGASSSPPSPAPRPPPAPRRHRRAD